MEVRNPVIALCSLQQEYERELKEAQKQEDEYKRQQQLRDRLFREEEERRMKEQ